MGSEVYHHLKSVIKSKFGLDVSIAFKIMVIILQFGDVHFVLICYTFQATSVGDEGGFAPNILNNKDALDLIIEAINKAGYTGKIEIGMDVAASEFHKKGQYDLDFKNPASDPSTYLSSDKLGELYQEFIKGYPMVSIEDPFDQDDWDAWAKLTGNTTIQVC